MIASLIFQKTNTLKMKKTLSTFFLAASFLLVSFIAIAQDALTGDITNATKNSYCRNGAIDLHINDGFAPYDVVWYQVIAPEGTAQTFEVEIQNNSGITGNNDGEDIENLIGNSSKNPKARIYYKVVVSDALCGHATKTFSIPCTCSNDCELDGYVTDASCSIKGEINVNISCTEDGHEPFEYKWDDGEIGQSRTDLSQGLYCVTATDRTGCEYERCFTVKDIGKSIEINLVQKKNIDFCKGSSPPCDGSLEIQVTEGVHFEWINIPNPSQTFENVVTDLCVGAYTVEAFSNGCYTTKTFHISCCETENSDPNDPGFEPLSITGKPSSTTNPESDNGKISLSVTGGTGEYSFHWTGPNGFEASSRNINNLRPGKYCVVVSDGCTEDKSCFIIKDCLKNPISVAAEIIETCHGFMAGSISLKISGGSPPYTVFWDNGMTGTDLGNLPEGTYCGTVIDNGGCRYKGNLCLTVGSKPGQVINTTIPCKKTILCNGKEHTTYYTASTTLNCNTLTYYCPLTQETITTDLGWRDIYTDNCIAYGLCWDGQEVVLEYGTTVTGPFIIYKNGCPSNFGCIDQYCQWPDGQTSLDDSHPAYCSSILYFNDNTCPKTSCRGDVYCGNTYMGSFCPPNSFCIWSVKPPKDIIITDNPILLKDNKNSPFLNLSPFSNDLTPIKEKVPSDINQELALSVSPNPFTDEILIQVDSKTECDISLKIGNILNLTVLEVKRKLEVGTNDFSIHLGRLPDGLYIVHLIKDGKIVASHQMAKQN